MSPPPAEQFAARIFMGPALRAQPDRRLVDLVRDGYDAAFEEIVRRYRRPLDRFAAGIVGGRSEDVTQDAFSKALLALRGTEAEIELRPWLYRIVRNTALNDLRDRAPATDELSDLLPGGRSAAAEAEAREELRDLMERLQALPEPQRAALVMRELEGLSHEEIAAALGVSGGAARQAIYRARAALRDGLGLLMPLPLLRALAEHGGDAGRAGGALAGAGASSAGGAALGGLGGAALKVGMATVLIAGTVGAGVAIQHDHGENGPDAAEAAARTPGSPNAGAAGEASTRTIDNGVANGRGRDDSAAGNRDSRGHGSAGGNDGGQLAAGTRSGSSGGPGSSGGSHSEPGGAGDGSHSGSGGSSPSSGSEDHSGSGSGSDDRHSGSDGGGDGSGGGGEGGSSSGSGSSGDGGGGSDDSGGGGDVSGGDGGSSGPGSGEVEPEPTPSEPTLSGDSGSSSGSGSSGSGGESSSGGTGSDDGLDTTGTTTSGSNGSP
ncbi:MAG: RNA polymerase sigma factor [Solirubrobacterales bacterium]